MYTILIYSLIKNFLKVGIRLRKNKHVKTFYRLNLSFHRIFLSFVIKFFMPHEKANMDNNDFYSI